MNFNDYIHIKEAASYLGVSCNTLRNWEKHGKFTSYRHPINNYRLYKKKDLETFLNKIK